MKDSKNKEFDINFRNVIKTPIRWFGLVYVYIIIIVIAVGWYYASHMNEIYMNSVPVALSTDTAKAEDEIKMVKGNTLAGVDVMKLSIPTPQLEDKGKELFKNNCASCHGENGDGNGPAGTALNPKPRNFHSNTGWVNGRKISDMFKTLEEGIPGSAMASFNYMPVEDRFAIIHYIRTFSPDFPKDTPDELKNLDQTYSLSTGRKTPSTIPVRMAVAKIASKGDSINNSLARINDYLNNHQSEQGAILLNRICNNKMTFIYSLSLNTIWENNLNSFIRICSVQPVQIGLNPSVISLNRNDWQILHDYIIRLFSQHNV